MRHRVATGEKREAGIKACRVIALLLASIFSLLSPAFSQVRTTVTDTLYAPNGSKLTGTLTVTANSTFTAADGTVVLNLTYTRVPITLGVFTVPLVPNAGGTPSGTSYSASYISSGQTVNETWVVPASGPVNLLAVRTSPAPTPGVTFPISQVLAPSPCASPNNFLTWSLTAWVCAGGSGAVFQVNGSNTTSQATINFQNSAAFNGITFSFANPSAGNVQLGASGTLNDAGLTGAYSGVAVCASSKWASTLTRNAGPTCTQPAFTDISGVAGAAQLPNPSASTLGGIQSLAAVASKWINTISTSGVPGATQPAFTDISGVASAAQLPNPSASTLGGIQSLAAVASKWINTISTSGVPGATQPACADLSNSATSCSVNPVASGTTPQAAYYAATGAAVSATPQITFTATGPVITATGTQLIQLASPSVTSAMMDLFDTTPSAPNPHKFLQIINGIFSVVNNAGTTALLTIPDSGINSGSTCGDTSHALNWSSVSRQIGCQTITGSAGAPNFPVNPQTATYQALASDFSSFKDIMVASGTFTITLVASGAQPANGQGIFVENYGLGVVTIARSGQNINGGTSSLTLAAGLATAPSGALIISDGTNYFALVIPPVLPSHGTDPQLQTSDGTGASNNLPKYDASGGLTDSGVGISSAVYNFFCTGVLSNTSVTDLIFPGSNVTTCATTTPGSGITMPFAGKIKAFYGAAVAGGVGAGAGVATLLDNGSAMSPSVTFTFGTATTGNDLTDHPTILAGHVLTVSVATGEAGTTLKILTFSAWVQ